MNLSGSSAFESAPDEASTAFAHNAPWGYGHAIPPQGYEARDDGFDRQEEAGGATAAGGRPGGRNGQNGRMKTVTASTSFFRSRRLRQRWDKREPYCSVRMSIPASAKP